MKRLLSLILLAVLLAGCQKEKESQTASVSFPLAWNAAQTKARADGSLADGLLVGVYEKDAAGKLTLLPELSLMDVQEALTVSGGAATFQVRLTRGRNYVLAFWVQNQRYQDFRPDFASGVMRMNPTVSANDSSRDAFFGVCETGVIASADVQIPGIKLKRPFARVQVLAPVEDWELAAKAGVAFSQSAFRVQQAPTALNLLTGEVSEPADISFTAAAVSSGETPSDKYKSTHKVLASNYILMGDERTLSVQLDVYTQLNGAAQEPFTFQIDNVKARRNYNTSVAGNVFTVETGFQLSMEAGFDSPDYTGEIPMPEHPDNPDPDNPDNPDTPTATGIVDTRNATGVSTVGATLNAYYHQVTGAVQEAGFYWGTSPYSLTGEVYTDYPPTGASGYFSADLTGLEEGTTYYYRAFIVEYDAVQSKFVDRLGSINTFTTSTSAPVMDMGYLNCFEMPAVSLDGTGDTGNKYGKWWSYGTTNSMQKVVTHTYVYNNKQYRNYTVLVDGSVKAPLWTAHVMHSGAYPKILSGRGSWDYDPAVPSSWQQSGVTGISGFGSYSKGHFVASSDRQTTNNANDQTFLYTNQAPQWQDGFNSGVWSSLETDIQKNAPSSASDTLYVVTGVLYEGSVKMAGSVPIPSHFYKCLMKCSFSGGTITAAQGCAYIFTNESHSGQKYYQGRTSIDAIEARTGFDFFANVPAALQGSAESSSSALWNESK